MDPDFVTNARFIIDTYFRNQEENVFNSHRFIEKYRKRFEIRYIAWLVSNIENIENIPSFQATNSQIAILLRDNQPELGITKLDKKDDLTDFGYENPVTNWRAN
ncbi:MAG: hypothetical protein K5633_03080 [Paludibacteraceae bacterium]|nr:hypothetical protein [Paludibacteraceae bacterium]